MKQLNISGWGFLLVLSFLLITGCEQTVDTPENSLSQDELAVFDKADAENGIQDATLESPFSFILPQDQPNFLRHNFNPGRSGRHLFWILSRLDLSDSQKEEVRNFMSENKVCVSDAMKKFKRAIEPILQDANDQRKTIIEALRNGEITREEAREQIHQLNRATRGLIKNSEASQVLEDELCECKSSLFGSIASILDEEQKVKWNRWISTLNGLCTGE